MQHLKLFHIQMTTFLAWLMIQFTENRGLSWLLIQKLKRIRFKILMLGIVFPADTQRLDNVASTSIKRHDVASTMMQRFTDGIARWVASVKRQLKSSEVFDIDQYFMVHWLCSFTYKGYGLWVRNILALGDWVSSVHSSSAYWNNTFKKSIHKW